MNSQLKWRATKADNKTKTDNKTNNKANNKTWYATHETTSKKHVSFNPVFKGIYFIVILKPSNGFVVYRLARCVQKS